MIRHSYFLLLLLAATPAAAQMGMQTPAQMEQAARCMGISIEDYRALYDPTNGEMRSPTKAERDKANEVMKRVSKVVPPQKRAQCEQAISQGMVDNMLGRMQKSIDSTEMRMANAGSQTEAPGKSARLSDDPAGDLAGGKTAVRDIDWVAGQGGVSEAGAASFTQAMTALAPALAAAGGHFRVDFYLDTRYANDAANSVAEQRMKTLRDALGGDVRLEKGKVNRDTDTRIEFVQVR
jgi:hypothetical protein